MSKRNGYRIRVTDSSQLEEIVESLKETGLVLEVSEPISGQTNRTITAEDAPKAGQGFADVSKDPLRYIEWLEVKHKLREYTDAISHITHKFSDDTICKTITRKYEVENGEFDEVSKEVTDEY
jgi:hypothetical protein